ncbi:MAG: hypothetical protein DHS20C15_28690 [Planctomycetota bacterium]|nr:MAG: hypothetical protein DHS20C15_28690 [Planctomycetota bacterium]
MSDTAPTPRLLVLGNAGAGKSTLARELAQQHAQPDGRPLAILCLDAIAFDGSTERRPLAESLALLDDFRAAHAGWVIEGCYADLAEALAPHAHELHFVDPGVEVCVAHCRARPWEPDKFATREAQDAVLDTLIAWVREYPHRNDEYGLRAHERVVAAFEGRVLRHGAP